MAMTDARRESAAEFDRIAARYFRHVESRRAGFEALARRFIQLAPSRGRLLDVACGTGHASALFGAVSDLTTVGIDLSTAMLRQARSHASSLCQADMCNLPFASAAFDLLWCSGALIHLVPSSLPECLSGFHRVLKPGGTLGVVTVAGDGRLWTVPSIDGRGHTRRLWAHEWEPQRRALVSAGFTPRHKLIWRSSKSIMWILMIARADPLPAPTSSDTGIPCENRRT